jgi:leucyl-tRNA synthetase
VLANEEVTSDGRSERGNFPVFRKRLRQWMMRITAYSDRLLDDLELLDWPDKVKTCSATGSAARPAPPSVRPPPGISRCSPPGPTPCSAPPTWCSPRASLVDTLTDAWPAGVDSAGPWRGTPADAVAAYRQSIAAKSDLERQENKSKTGVFTGVPPIPLTDSRFRCSSPTTC